MEKKKRWTTRALIECSLMIAVGSILAKIALFHMPLGGAVTAGSLVPFILISYRHGTDIGIFSGIVNSIFQMTLGGIYPPPSGTAAALITSIMLDYVLAFCALGTAAFFSDLLMHRAKNAGEKAAGSAADRAAGLHFSLGSVLFGSFAACFLRFMCSFVSGFVIWASLTTEGIGAVIYSLTYNLSYMAPETALTLIIIFMLYKKCPFLFRRDKA